MIGVKGGKYLECREEKKFGLNGFVCDGEKKGKYVYMERWDGECGDEEIKSIVGIIR